MSEPKQDKPLGVPCRRCGCCHHRTLRVIHLKEGKIRRRRECRRCGLRFNTTEAPAA